MEKEFMPLIAIVAIVAIVGIVGLTYMMTTATSGSNLVGQAIRDVDPECFATCENAMIAAGLEGGYLQIALRGCADYCDRDKSKVMSEEIAA